MDNTRKNNNNNVQESEVQQSLSDETDRVSICDLSSPLSSGVALESGIEHVPETISPLPITSESLDSRLWSVQEAAPSYVPSLASRTLVVDLHPLEDFEVDLALADPLVRNHVMAFADLVVPPIHNIIYESKSESDDDAASDQWSSSLDSDASWDDSFSSLSPFTVAEMCILRYRTVEMEAEARIEVASRLPDIPPWDPVHVVATNFIRGNVNRHPSHPNFGSEFINPYDLIDRTSIVVESNDGDDDGEFSTLWDCSDVAASMRLLGLPPRSILACRCCDSDDPFDGDSHLAATHWSLCFIEPFEIDCLSLDWQSEFRFEADEYQLKTVDFEASLLHMSGRFIQSDTMEMLLQLCPSAILVPSASDHLTYINDLEYVMDSIAVFFTEADLPEAQLIAPHSDLVPYRDYVTDCEIMATLNAYKSIGLNPGALLDMQSHDFYLNGGFHEEGKQVRSVWAQAVGQGIRLIAEDKVYVGFGHEWVVWVLNPQGATAFYVQTEDPPGTPRWAVTCTKAHVILRHFGNAAALAENRNALMHALNGNHMCDVVDCIEVACWTDLAGNYRCDQHIRSLGVIAFGICDPLSSSFGIQPRNVCAACAHVPHKHLVEGDDELRYVCSGCDVPAPSSGWVLESDDDLFSFPRETVISEQASCLEIRWPARDVLITEDFDQSPSPLPCQVQLRRVTEEHDDEVVLYLGAYNHLKVARFDMAGRECIVLIALLILAVYVLYAALGL